MYKLKIVANEHSAEITYDTEEELRRGVDVMPSLLRQFRTVEKAIEHMWKLAVKEGRITPGG